MNELGNIGLIVGNMSKKLWWRERWGLDELNSRGIEHVQLEVESYREKENIFVIEATHALKHRS